MNNPAFKSPTYEELLERLQELEKTAEATEKVKELLCEFEEKIKEREALLESIIESLPFDLFVLDQDGRYILENTTCKRHYDGSIIGKKPGELDVPEATLNLWEENNRRAFAGEIVDAEVAFEVRDELHYYRNIISPILVEDEIKGIVGVNLDLKDKVERALLEQSLWDIFNHIRFFVVILDARCRIKKANTWLAKTLGYNRCDEMVGLNWHNFIPESITKTHHIMMDAIRTGEATDSEMVSEIVDLKGDRISVRWFHSPANSEWIFSVGVPLKSEITPSDSIEDLRTYWQECISKDRTMIRSLKVMAESEWRKRIPVE